MSARVCVCGLVHVAFIITLLLSDNVEQKLRELGIQMDLLMVKKKYMKLHSSRNS